jgi:hypothetical protein
VLLCTLTLDAVVDVESDACVIAASREWCVVLSCAVLMWCGLRSPLWLPDASVSGSLSDASHAR